ncbi:hypothetical protein D0817_20265 [Flavobacterium cupreum]|uniref:Uncharacterized protein n=1 Tax=Flavobacterium cupreum TaxID=2133766 RepID=A0A434A2Z7_9FLAO|nr:hypothetical protein [Flavobacterium cupreum]RUT68697.1 hypothetical protein D0817_20265 [Flavobacterium cupreum]
MFEQSQVSYLIYKNRTDIVPEDPSNPLRIEFEEWLSLGNYLTMFEGTPGEVNPIKVPQYLIGLQVLISDLRIRAKTAVIENEKPIINNVYVLTQCELNEIKYQLAKGLISDPDLELYFENEADLFGVSLAQHKANIIAEFEASDLNYKIFMMLIEMCRTKIQKLIRDFEFAKADDAQFVMQSFVDIDSAKASMDYILGL